MATKAEGQLGMDERIVEDPEVEAALERRQTAKDQASAVRARYEEANVAAAAAIDGLNLAEGEVVRIGRFRVSRNSVPARSVAFETEATTRVSIVAAEE